MKDSASVKRKKYPINWAFIAGLAIIVVVVTLVLCLALRGNTSTTGAFPNPETSEYISCEATGVTNSIFDVSNASSYSTRAVATFNSSKLSSVSVSYTLNYANESEVNGSEAINHAALNLATQKEGLGADIFNAHFSKLSDRLEIRLYAEADDITTTSSKYLMLNTAGSYSMSSIKQNYQSQGFACTSKTN